MKNKTYISVFCSIGLLITNIIIGFFLSPFIVKNIGVEANGFVTLANNFVTYAQLIVTALNSMAAQFITIAYIRKDYKKANLYYNSAFWGNLIIVAVLIIPSSCFILKMENFVNIPENILFDVKLLFSFIFLNFFLTTGFPNWDCGTFVSNRLDRTYIPTAFTSILRCVVLFSMMTFLTPKVWYVGFTSSIVTIVLLIIAWYNTHKLTPELKIEFENNKPICSKSAVKNLVGSGLWNSVSSLGNMLLSGMDLIICNLFLGATAMGVLSLAKMLVNYIQQLAASIRSTFAPELTINYAESNQEKLISNLSSSMKLTAFIMTIPVVGIIVLGDKFFALWVPSQDAKLLQILCILSIFGYIFSCGIQILFNVFQTVNKVKINAIAILISGCVSIFITLILVKFTSLGIYAVAGVSSFVNLFRNLFFMIPVTSKYLGVNCKVFYKQVGKTVFISIVLICVGFFIKNLIPISNWLSFFGCAVVMGMAGLCLNFYFLLSKVERNILINKIKKKIGK